MEKYKKILVAVELNPETDKHLILSVAELVKKTGAVVTLVHAVEHIASYGGMYGATLSAGLEETLLRSSQKEMELVGKELGVPKERQIIGFGVAEVVVTEKAEALGVDLIVVGSHGRRGIQILLGSTANAVLHRAKCDVFVVRTDAKIG